MNILTTPLILDILAVGITVICFIIGWRRGLVSTLIKLAGFALSALGAWWASGKLADIVYEKFLKDRLVAAVSEKVAGDAAASGTADALSGLVNKLLGAAAGVDTSAASESIVDSVLSEPATAVVRAILFILLFLIFSLVIKLITRAFRGLNDVPVLGGVNKVCGGIVGVAEGLLICYIVVALVSVVITLSADGLTWLNTQLVNDSKLFSLLYNYNPLKAVLDSGILEGVVGNTTE